MKLKKKIDNLEASLGARLDSIEEALEKVVARGEVVQLLQEENSFHREEKEKLLDRLMARDFESLKTYSSSTVDIPIGEPIKLQEDEDMAGEIFDVEN